MAAAGYAFEALGISSDVSVGVNKATAPPEKKEEPASKAAEAKAEEKMEA